MIYNRLISDFMRAKHHDGLGNTAVAKEHLNHAQDIIVLLIDSLDVNQWEAGATLQELYRFTFAQISEMFITWTPELIDELIERFTPLRDAWLEAANSLTETEGERTASLNVTS